jgi:multidrug resistance efflux pump
MKIKGLILPFVALFCLVYAAISIANTQPRLNPTDPPAPPPRSAFPETVAATGLIEPASEVVTLSPHVSGVVEAVFVKVGDDVQMGQPLLKVDTRALEATRRERLSDLKARKAAVTAAAAQIRMAEAAAQEAREVWAISEQVRPSGGISKEELVRKRSAVDSTAASLDEARAGLQLAEAQVAVVESQLHSLDVELERSVMTAPLKGRILQVRIRPGEYAGAVPGSETAMVMGNTETLHVRVDVDEHEAWRVNPDAAAKAQLRGNPALSSSLEFVRFEPLVIPKRSLTGDSTERVDTRALQIIYRLADATPAAYVGQQMDVFIHAGPPL